MHNIHEKYGNAKAGFIKVLRSDNKHVGNKIRQLTPFFNLAPPHTEFLYGAPSVELPAFILRPHRLRFRTTCHELNYAATSHSQRLGSLELGKVA